MIKTIQGLVSVIIPCYQQERFIGEAIQSVCAQTYSDWECIVVNDGSTDSSANIISEFVSRDERVKYIFQNNAGVSKARNCGFEHALGEFICFLDGDDYMKPEKIRHQAESFIGKPEIDVSYCDHIHRFEDKKLEEHYETKRLGPSPLEDFLFSWDRGFSIPPICGMFRRSIWAENELPFAPDYNGRWEDWIFWIDLCLRGCRFSFLDHKDAVYRIHSTNFTKDLRRNAESAIQAASYIAPRLPDQYRDRFLSETISFQMDRYVQWRLDKELRQSVFFKTIKAMSTPFRLILGPKLRSHIKQLLFGNSCQ